MSPRTPPSSGSLLLAAVMFTLCVGCSVDVDSDDGSASGGDAGPGSDARIAATFNSIQKEAIRGLWAGNLESKRPEDPTNRVANNDRAAKLGHFLFYDKGLSSNGEVNCASCHPPDHGFAGPKARADQGLGETDRNAPTLINVGFQDWYFWGGRTDTVWAQAVQPIESPIEMGSSRLEVAHHIYDNPKLKEAYEAIGTFAALPNLSNTNRFPEEGRPVETPQSEEEKQHNQAWESMSEQDRRTINTIMANVMKCIAAFEMRLNSLNTPFDRFAEGLLENKPDQLDAIGPQAVAGLKLFVGDAQCTKCHNGPMLASKGGKFHNVGPPKPDWIEEPDLGRWTGLRKVKENPFNSAGRYSDAPDGQKARFLGAVSRNSADKGAFKVPTLRHIEDTGPYMHAGQFETLREVLEFYSELDNPAPVGSRSTELEATDFSDEEIEQLTAFMKTLDAEDAIPAKYKRQPESPLP